MAAEAKIGNVIYGARTRTSVGREHGLSRSSDGYLDVKLAGPGSACIGTNPEQLLAAGWSACLGRAIALAARNSKVALSEVTIDAEVDLHLADGTDCFLSARFIISIPGVDHTVARHLVRQADHLCPFSRTMRGNIDVTFSVV
jgi:lipoyl-dependent peroxiredoxin